MTEFHQAFSILAHTIRSLLSSPWAILSDAADGYTLQRSEFHDGLTSIDKLRSVSNILDEISTILCAERPRLESIHLCLAQYQKNISEVRSQQDFPSFKVERPQKAAELTPRTLPELIRKEQHLGVLWLIAAQFLADGANIIVTVEPRSVDGRFHFGVTERS